MEFEVLFFITFFSEFWIFINVIYIFYFQTRMEVKLLIIFNFLVIY
jgi:hypothetical protein